MIAVSNCTLYTKEHEAFDDMAKQALVTLQINMDEKFEIMILDNELVVNKVPFRDSGLHGNNLIKRLKKKKTSSIEFFKDITLSEMKQFIIDLSQAGRELKSYPHIRIGSVTLYSSGAADSLQTGSLLHDEQSETIKDVFHSASPFKALKVVALEEVVLNFIASFKKGASVLKHLSPVKSYNEYTYTHATNVAILSLFQAESLGIKDELLYDIGIAALLHDSGKLFISGEILDKKSRLDEREFAEIQKHPLYGAKYLAKINNLTRLAPIVAYEHHMKYDGTGYPEAYEDGKSQHICSQIVAISDFFDALRSRRSYRESVNTEKIVGMMKKSSDTDFNPFLLDNFIRLLYSSETEGENSPLPSKDEKQNI